MRLSILRVVEAICRDPVMRLHDRHSKGKERGGGGGGFHLASEDAN